MMFQGIQLSFRSILVALLVLAAGAALESPARADVVPASNDPYYAVQSVEVIEDEPTEGELFLLQLIRGNSGQEALLPGLDHVGDVLGSLNEATLILDAIINIGEKVWTILEKGKPVINYESKSASAVPKGVKSWMQMQGWKEPGAKAFTFRIINGFGTDAVRFRYLVLYNYGGNIRGKGKYLSEVQIMKTEVHLLPTFDLDVKARVRSVVNEGKDKDPMAGMQIYVDLDVNTPFTTAAYSRLYYMRGDGLFKDLTFGNMQ